MHIYIIGAVVLVSIVLIWLFSKFRVLYVALILGMVFLIFWICVFQVNQGSQVVVTRFGKIIHAPYEKPGLYFRIPLIWKLHYFDRRIYVTEEYAGHIPTQDGHFIFVDIAFFWRIQDPASVLSNITGASAEGATIFLRNMISGSVKENVSKHILADLIHSAPDSYHTSKEKNSLRLTSTDPATPFGRKMLEDKVLNEVKAQAAPYGIQIMNVFIIRVAYDPTVEEAIYTRMIAEKLREASFLIGEGTGEAMRVKGLTNEVYQSIVAPAKQQALLIMGKAEAEATLIQARAYGKDREFYEFWRTLRIYQENLAQKSKGLVLSTDSPFFQGLATQYSSIHQQKSDAKVSPPKTSSTVNTNQHTEG